MSVSYPSNDSYPALQSASSIGNGDVDIDVFPLPPNIRSMSMTDQPIVDPDFGWFDTYPAAQFSDFASSPSSSSSGSIGQQYDWSYDPLPPPAVPQMSASVSYPADAARPHPAHPNNGVAVPPQPAHGLTPIIPPQQRPVPTPPANYTAHSQQPSKLPQQPPYSQQHPRQPQQPSLYEQPPQYQHAASFPPPSYPPQHPPSEQQQHQQQQLAQIFTQHSRRASTPSYPAGTPVPYTGGRQSVYGADDHSPVSHVSSVSSLSSHSSSSSDGLEGVGHKRKQSTDSNPAEANGVEHSPTETTAAAGKGRGRGASKKQKASNTNNSKAKANAKTPPTSTAAVKPKSSDAPHTTPASAASAAPAASTSGSAVAAAPGVSVHPDHWLTGGAASSAMSSVNRTTDKDSDNKNVAWPFQVSTYNAMQHYFVSSILGIKQPDAPTITDIIHLIAHAMEVAPAASMAFLLRRLGYVPQPCTETNKSIDDSDCKRVVWRSSNPHLPYMTLPHHFRLNWSVSPETTMPEDTTVINFPTLQWWRAKESRFIRRPDGSVQALEVAFHPSLHAHIQQQAQQQQQHQQQQRTADSPFSTSDTSTAATPTPQTPATPATEPASPSTFAAPSSTALPSLPPGEIDMSVLDLPCHVEVNSAFERMFGYSQSEIRIMFIRHGKQALARLADAQQFRQCHELSMRDACEGQQEFSHVIEVRPKYGGTMKTVMHQKLVVGNEGLVWKKIYCWIPLTRAMKDAYVAAKQAAGVKTEAGWCDMAPTSESTTKEGQVKTEQSFTSK